MEVFSPAGYPDEGRAHFADCVEAVAWAPNHARGDRPGAQGVGDSHARPRQMSNLAPKVS